MAVAYRPIVNIPTSSAIYMNHQELTLSLAMFPLGGANGSMRNKALASRLYKGFLRNPSSTHVPLLNTDVRSVRCNIFSGGDGNVTDDFSENDEDYIDSTVLEAVEVKSGLEGFLIKMRDGRYIKCVHNNAATTHLPEYSPQPAIVLKMQDDSNLLLPIIVLELPRTMLMEALRNVQVSRPTVYHIMKDMIELMGYKATMVRVTKRVHEAYFARLYLSKTSGEDREIRSIDLRPSDGINLAVRCKVPIQVHKELALGDGVKIVSDPAKLSALMLRSPNVEMDRPASDFDPAAEEFVLVRSMIVAAVEERYNDAARIRDQLSRLRSKKARGQQA